MDIEVTDVIVFPVKNKTKLSRLSAFAIVVINDQLSLQGIKIHLLKSGPVIIWPKYTCRPIQCDIQEKIGKEILKQYSLTMAHAKEMEI